ncbi:ImmA/IrrE family metallo-endopeptidase [Enterococcus ureasiticus]|uniref:ImmA/IrrE family metallo-endopeptidase n=1 Tax=Enterococcus ureasiticus TaxID=903984 RepID=UPI001A8FA355|nr:ImmA/IrrE family metallo-endopeptidase [Enterococcus ureasiticus]MBO0473287.1 ImmA/IrrE family metallo-endopeptidase [Enterococcus ureasiticus]
MDDYELLLDEVQTELPVIEGSLFEKTGRQGLYRSGRIYIEKTLPPTKKREVLAEEYGHFKTSVGNILDQKKQVNRKQELQARNVSYENIISLEKLIECSEANLSNHYECAEFLNVSVEILKNALVYYQQKYGCTHFYKGRIFEFRDLSVIILNTGLLQEKHN